MKRYPLAVAIAVTLSVSASADNWPAWRGPLGNGHSKEKRLPVKWSATENVKWKIALPDVGNSTPILWGDHILLTQATRKGQKRALMCFARRDGKLLWEKAVDFAGNERTCGVNPYCSPSPVTDGERIFVSHASAGVFCYSFEGKELWHRDDLGVLDHNSGPGASPGLYGDLLLLN